MWGLGAGAGGTLEWALFAMHPAQLSDAVHAGGGEEGVLRHIPSPSFPFSYCSRLCFVTKGCFLRWGCYLFPSAVLMLAEGCRAPWKSSTGSLCWRAGPGLGNGGCRRGFVQGGGPGINLKTRFCVSFRLE